MKVLLTGAAGRLGRYVLEALREHGMEVCATDVRLPKEPGGQGVRVANLVHREICYELAEGMDAVVHLGNIPVTGIFDEQKTFAENCAINVNVFQAAAELGVRHIVFASSIQVISGGRTLLPGPSSLPYLPVDGHTPVNPGNTYAASKVAAEELLRYYSRWHGLITTAIRFPGMTRTEHLKTRPGAFDSYKTVERRYARHYNPDEAMTSLTFLDGADLIRTCLQKRRDGYRCYLPSGPGRIFLQDTLQELYEAFFANCELRRPLDQLTQFGDNAHIREDVDWEPTGRG